MFQGSGWANAARNGPAEAGAMRLAVDVIETDDAFTFATDVPGVSRQDVKACLAPLPYCLPPPAHCGCAVCRRRLLAAPGCVVIWQVLVSDGVVLQCMS